MNFLNILPRVFSSVFAHKTPSLAIITHHRHSDLTRIYLVEEDKTNRIRGSEIATLPIPRSCVLENTCNGLLCFVKHRVHNDDEIFICNPLRKQVATFSAPSTPYVLSRQIYGLGYSSSTNEYKLVFVDTDLNTKIYSLNSNAWKEVASKPPCAMYGSPVYSNGALHWKTDFMAANSHIVSFDMEKEEFEIINQPLELLDSEKRETIDVTVLQGNLCLVDLSFCDHIDIWMLVERQWVLKYRIEMNNSERAKFIGFWKSSKIFFTLNDDNYLTYDTGTGVLDYHNVVGLDPGYTISKVFAHTESLVALEADAQSSNHT